MSVEWGGGVGSREEGKCVWQRACSLFLFPTLQHTSSSGACELTLGAPECGFDTPAAVEPLTFTVKDEVPVREFFWGRRTEKGNSGEEKTTTLTTHSSPLPQVKAVAFKVLHGCEGGACSFSV